MRHADDKGTAQGDVLLRRIDKLPAAAMRRAVKPNDKGEIVVTHSETGHHHVMVLDRSEAADVLPAVEMYESTDNPLMAWIKVNRPTALEHHRSYDTHEPIMFEPGVYEVRRQREWSPDLGARKVMD